MRQGWQELLLQSLVLLGALVAAQEDADAIPDLPVRGSKLFGDRCNSTSECGFDDSVCDKTLGTCQCVEDFVSNHIDKCGKKATVNESCFFNEQCEITTPNTECRDVCVCRFEQQAILIGDGTFKCIAVRNVIVQERYVDPAMIGILVAMFLMFITICVVLRLFSKARWRENRSIFNTPNPRLMNVSLLRDSKLLHQERRGSRSSVRGPSRQPSMASLRAHSPNSQGSRRDSKGSSNASATSLRSNKSPPTALQPNPANTTTLESVTVEVQECKS